MAASGGTWSKKGFKPAAGGSDGRNAEERELGLRPLKITKTQTGFHVFDAMSTEDVTVGGRVIVNDQWGRTFKDRQSAAEYLRKQKAMRRSYLEG